MAEHLTDHIVRAYNHEFKRLDTLIAEMGGHCEEQLAAALRALDDRNRELAEQTAAQDIVIDSLEREIEALVIRLLALRQPVAIDLRHALAMLKVSAALERIGDHAKNIAKRAAELAGSKPLAPIPQLVGLGRLVQGTLHSCLDALVSRDPERATEVWRCDREIDDLHAATLQAIYGCMRENPDEFAPCSSLQFIAKNLERIGDLSTNIAEMVLFDATGRRVEEPRPRGG